MYSMHLVILKYFIDMCNPSVNIFLKIYTFTTYICSFPVSIFYSKRTKIALSLYPVSPPGDNTFALPSEVFSSCLAIVSAIMVGALFLWPALRHRTGYQTVWETRPSAETPSDVHWRRFYFQLTCVHSALELSGRCAQQIYLLTYLLSFSQGQSSRSNVTKV